MRGALGIVGASFLLFACVGEDPAPTSTSSGGSGGSGGGGPGAQIVQCNDKRCAAGEVCCLTLGALSDSSVQKAECTPSNACNTGTALVCDDSADCPSAQVCCVKTNGGSVKYGPSFCSAQCSSPERQLCASADDCGGKSCAAPQSATTPTGLMQCAE